MCTNTSFPPPPPDGWMKPYPFVGLNHFTVPVATVRLLVTIRRQSHRNAVKPNKAPPNCTFEHRFSRITRAVVTPTRIGATDLSQMYHYTTNREPISLFLTGSQI